MKSLATKILLVIKELDGKVQKTGWNNFQKYKYITEADITEALRPALLKHKVVIFSSIVESKEMSPGGKSGDQKIYQVIYKHTLVDADSGETLEVMSAGTGADSLDKAIYKAKAGAFKYFAMKNFMISGDGEDPENDSSKNSSTEEKSKSKVTTSFSTKSTTPTTKAPTFGTKLKPSNPSPEAPKPPRPPGALTPSDVSAPKEDNVVNTYSEANLDDIPF